MQRARREGDISTLIPSSYRSHFELNILCRSASLVLFSVGGLEYIHDCGFFGVKHARFGIIVRSGARHAGANPHRGVPALHGRGADEVRVGSGAIAA